MKFSKGQKLLLIRTLSNRPLITEEEQLLLYSKKIAIIGLSVGSQAALTLVRSGVSGHFTLVDPDEVELKNLNRTPFFLKDVGKKKVTALSYQLHQIDPYVKITKYNHILSQDELKTVVADADVIIDAFDDFKQKVRLREFAQEYKKIVVTGFDIDRGAMVIVERYDSGWVDSQFFYNNLRPEMLTGELKSVSEKISLFISLIGKENHSQAMLTAVENVGTLYSSIPQLMIATNLLASLWTIVVTDALLNKQSSSLRKYINLDTAIYT